REMDRLQQERVSQDELQMVKNYMAGAIFWMWIAAFFGMATIFAEAVLAQVYKEKMPDGSVVGGPAYYISRGLKSNGLAVFFSVAIIMALGFIGNMVQSNSIADAFNNAFGVNRLLIGVIVAAIGGFVFFGGMGRIASITEKIVPIMAAGYLLGGLYILVTHASHIIPAFGMVFEGAFNPAAATGGLIGATMKEAIRYGVARGLFSNEAGMGSTPHAHAVAKVKDPAEQGFVAIMGVFVDTFLVLNMTAFVIFVTGAIDGKTSGIALTQSAFSTGLGSFGLPFVAICMFFFAFSTIVGWYFFGEQNVKFLFGNKGLTPYRIVVMAFVVLGATLKLDLVWELADFFNGIMVFPNLIALIGLSKVVSEALNHFDDQGRLKANTK
uniref:alanine/glycine:cation symporter family protein n=1 Tax=uncultured Cloacibacillus sp. TaxID=889794 RepID=UPI002586B6A1